MSRPEVERVEGTSLLGIGPMARASGLTVSALRFYDGAGVLGPEFVDPDSGYRFYAPEQLAVARLVAALRRAGMPLGGVREVLANRHDPEAVDALLAAHLRGLERGLAEARRVLSTVAALLTLEENLVPTTLTVAASDLLAALRAVRFAAAAHPDHPVLGSVLFELDAGALTLVATDRYRLAVATVVPDQVTGPPVTGPVPLPVVDGIAALATGADSVEVTIDAAAVTARAGSTRVEGELLPDAFPDYRRLLPSGREPVPVDAAALRAAVTAGPTLAMRRDPDGVEFAATVLALGADGVVVADDGIGVNREFLLEAVDAGGGGQLQLELDGPLNPLVIRSAGSMSLLMPVRL